MSRIVVTVSVVLYFQSSFCCTNMKGFNDIPILSLGDLGQAGEKGIPGIPGSAGKPGDKGM